MKLAVYEDVKTDTKATKKQAQTNRQQAEG